MTSVSIIFNLYLPQQEIIQKILTSLEHQECDDDIELVIVDKKINAPERAYIEKFKKSSKKMDVTIISVDEHLSFASSMNAGIKKSRGEISVVLQQDCIPTSDEWLRNLIAPFKNKNVVATVSKVMFPDELWDRTDLSTRALIIREKGTITPLLDEKGCAYRREVLERVGFFNDRDFKTAGEDFDLYIKLKRAGTIAYPDATIIHYHPTNLGSRLKKVEQYANGFGTLVRIHGTHMPGWYKGLLKSIPVLGLAGLIASYPIRKEFYLYGRYLLLVPQMHVLYIRGFWTGFISGRQVIDVLKKNTP